MTRSTKLIVLLFVVLATLVGCCKSKERRAQLEGMLTEYNQLVDSTMSISQRLAGGDLSAMQAMTEQVQKATDWTTKWEAEMQRLGPELSQEDKDYLEAEFKKSMERYMELVPQSTPNPLKLNP